MKSIADWPPRLGYLQSRHYLQARHPLGYRTLCRAPFSSLRRANLQQ
ncbi:hypothetical protein BLA_0160 [Bifidobacterium animalis subsp. lactis AD011]|uniref:Uncharacterized protein n=1 Tax=Bifidobacterium animalis subsp. lactis (strain AD011) TaxID=442563 RepID=B8DVG1_BIFA0|nr:hypothetical protein BLA_0160 [Bifidobacterium animalis subsp. lactis AD011]